MSRRFIAIILAASMTVTGLSTVEARAADADEIAKVLGAAATLYIIGKAIEQHNDRGKKKKSTHSAGRYDLKVHQKPRNNRHSHNGYAHSHKNGFKHHHHQTPKAVAPRYNGGHATIRRVHPHRTQNHPLPGFCLLDVQDRGKNYRAFGKRCLKRNYSQAASLPDRCLRQVTTARGTRNIYKARCLRKRGFQIAGR